ncbi:MAG: hypothetical protein PVI23_08000 [Maricaulaceae bacterium]|jgi:hypothetical protein
MPSDLPAPPSLKKLKSIWLAANVGGVAAFVALIPALLNTGAEWLPVVLWSAVGGVAARFALLFALVPLRAPELDRFVKAADVKREGDDVSVQSEITLSGDPAVDGFIRSYRDAKDWTIKTIVLAMVALILLVAIRLIHGPVLFLR